MMMMTKKNSSLSSMTSTGITATTRKAATPVAMA